MLQPQASARWWTLLALCAVVGSSLGPVLGGCPADPGVRGRDPIATVGESIIDERRVMAILAQRGVARVADLGERKLVTRQILEQLVEEELLMQGATTVGVTVSEEAVDREIRNRTQGCAAGSFQSVLTSEQLTMDSFRDGIRRHLTQDAYLRQRLGPRAPVPEAEIQALYDSTVALTKKPQQVRARQVLVRTAEDARHVLELIHTRKMTTEQAAVKFSVGLEADVGGDLGWFAQGEMPAVFDICFLFTPGQVSDVVSSDYGFHIFQLTDKRDERIETYKAVRDSLAEDLVRERQSAAVASIIADLHRQVPVRIAKDGIERLTALLPEAPKRPTEVIDQGNARSLDSHIDGAIDPIPPLIREKREQAEPKKP